MLPNAWLRIRGKVSPMAVYAAPGQPASPISLPSRYGNWIAGESREPVLGRYAENTSPVTGEVYTEVARSTVDDVELALDAAEDAFAGWSTTTPTDRAIVLNKIADRLEEQTTRLAVTDVWDSGKPIREVLSADLPTAVDHFRQLAGAITAQEGGISQHDGEMVACHRYEPLGVVAQSVPWTFSLLCAAWNLAPALAAGNTVVLRPAEQTPVSIMELMRLIADLLPPGVVNVVNGLSAEVATPLVSSHRVRKAVLTDNTGATCSTLYFADVLEVDDEFSDRVLDGFTTFALNQGEACGAPSRALVELPIYHEFVETAAIRTKAIRQGNPLDTETVLGAQTSEEQLAKILEHVRLAKESGLRVLTGGARAELGDDLANGYYMQPTIVEATDSLWEAIAGPVVSVASFEDYSSVIRMANEAPESCAAALWSRDLSLTYHASRDLRAKRLFANCSPAYSAAAAYGRLEQPPLTDYQRRKNLVLSYGLRQPW